MKKAFGMKLHWLSRYKALIFVVFILLVLISIRFPPFVIKDGNIHWSEWTGIGADSTVSSSKEEVEQNGTIISTKRVRTEHFSSGKTLWDWLNILIVPASLAVLGLLFQRQQQQQSDKQAKLEKEIASINLHEEALQSYLDRLSDLLINKELVNLSNDDPLREVALDIIHARTLSILRRLGNDGTRKGSVIQFLTDVGLVGRDFSDRLKFVNLRYAPLRAVSLKSINLCGVDLSYADMSFSRLDNANLNSSKLYGTNLESTDLGGADLECANLYGANLERASLINCNLMTADLSRATLKSASLLGSQLIGADLSDANLENSSLVGADLRKAKLNRANLRSANLTGANLELADLHEADLTNVTGLQKCHITQASNWEQAKYDEAFLKELGLEQHR
ncbi:pentapeptide repeat-containing protein [Cyanobacteria bacterium FACHB-63]|nr:pentapeptide repeat-containing protein [Cyanobacteria bacterium FACHB-63]